MQQARFAVLASRLPVATSSSRRTHPAVAYAMRSPSMNSPYGCPHNELICDYTHLTISRAMSFIWCSHFAVARAMSSPPDTSHVAAFLRDEIVFRHPASRSCPREPVVFSDYTCIGRPRNCVRSATVTDLVSQTDDFRFATHLSRFSFPNREESRRAHSNSGYPKLELTSPTHPIYWLPNKSSKVRNGFAFGCPNASSFRNALSGRSPARKAG